MDQERRESEQVKQLNVPEIKHHHRIRQEPPPIHMTHTPPPEDTSMDSFVSAPEEPRSYSMGDMLTSQEMLARDHNDSTTALLRENPISRRHSLTVSREETDPENTVLLLKQQFKTVAIETVTGVEPRDPVICDTQVTCSPDHVVVSTGANHMTYPTCLYTWTLVDQKLSNPFLARHKLKYALVAIPIPVSGSPNLSRSMSRVSLSSSSRMSLISVDENAAADKRRSSSFGRLKSLLRMKEKEVVTKPYVPSTRDKPEYSLVMLFESKSSQQMWKEKLGYLLEGDAQNRVISPEMTRHRPHTPPQDEDLGFKVDRDRLRSYMDVGGWSKLVRKRDSVIETSDKSDSRRSGSLRKSRSFKNFRESFYSSKTIDLEESDHSEARDSAKASQGGSKIETSGVGEKDGDRVSPSLEHAQEGFSTTPLENVPCDEGLDDSSSCSVDHPAMNGMFQNDDFYRRPQSDSESRGSESSHSHFEVDLSRDLTLKRRPQGIGMAREVSEGTVREGEMATTITPPCTSGQSRGIRSYDMRSYDPLSHDHFSHSEDRSRLETPDDEWTRLSTYTLNTSNSSCPITPVTPVLEVNHVSPVIAAFSANTTPPINMLHTVPSNVSTIKSVSNHHHMTYSDHMGYSDHVPHVPPLKTPLWLPGHSKAKSDIRAALARDRGGNSSTPVTPVASTVDLLTLTRDRSCNDMVSLKSREFQLKSSSGRPQLHKTVSNPCLVEASDEADKMNKISSEAARLWLKRRQSIAAIALTPPVSLQQLVKEPAVRKMTKNVYNGQLPGWHALSQASSRVPGVPVPKA